MDKGIGVKKIVLFCLLALFLCRCEKGGSKATYQESSLSSGTKRKVPKGEIYPGTLKEIKKRKKLRVLMPSQIDAAFPRKGNLLSFERDMAEAFARELGVTLEIIPIENYANFTTALTEGKGDLSMASLTITEERKKSVRFSTPVDYTQEVIVGKKGDRAKGMNDLREKKISVRGSSAYVGTLEALRDSFDIHIEKLYDGLHTYEIVEDITAGTYDYTLCDNDIAEAVASYEDGVEILFSLGAPRPRAWAVAPKAPKLLAEVNRFITQQKLSRSRLEKEFGDLPQIKERQRLRVAIRNNAATYWIHKGQEVGFEYDLLQAFAKKQDLRLEMVVASDRANLLDLVTEGKADMAAAGITRTKERLENFEFGAPYLNPEEVVVCLKDSSGNPVVSSMEQLWSSPIHIRTSSSYYSTLKELEEKEGRKFTIIPVSEELETENIIQQVAEGTIPVTIADNHLAQIEMVYNDRITTGPVIASATSVGWVMRKDAPLLKKAVDDFFTTGEYKPKALKYNMLYSRYFKNEREIKAAKSEARADIKGVISPYDSLMKKVAVDRSLDWYMIAAQAYQESKFNPKAQSWVGALGLMQLMPLTAKEVGVTNREDPYQSLHGGAVYMNKLFKRFDETIPYEERYNFALASYNAGYGHVLDARRLATKKGWDNRIWFGNVEKAMLLLAEPTYAKSARYGYCRGSEPVTYVKNIQRLYNNYSQVK